MVSANHASNNWPLNRNFLAEIARSKIYCARLCLTDVGDINFFKLSSAKCSSSVSTDSDVCLFKKCIKTCYMKHEGDFVKILQLFISSLGLFKLY